MGFLVDVHCKPLSAILFKKNGNLNSVVLYAFPLVVQGYLHVNSDRKSQYLGTDR